MAPELASLWLERNAANRNLRPSRVAALARDMECGAWRFTGESISFAPDGTLLNGQHRLSAIVTSGVPARLVVVAGCPPDGQDTMDSGASRKLADVLRMRGVDDPAAVSAVLHGAVRLLNLGERGSVRSGGALAATRAECLILYASDRAGVDEAARIGRQLSKVLLGGVSLHGGRYYDFARIDREAAAGFFDGLLTGADLASGSPVLALRSALAKGAPRPMNMREMEAFYIKSWNAYRRGAEVYRLKWNRSGPNAEQFPVAV